MSKRSERRLRRKLYRAQKKNERRLSQNIAYNLYHENQKNMVYIYSSLKSLDIKDTENKSENVEMSSI